MQPANLGPSLVLLQGLQQTRCALAAWLADCRLPAPLAAAAARQHAARAVHTVPQCVAFQLLPMPPPLRCRWAGEEERELAARRLRLLVYLLRDPVFSRYTQVGSRQACVGCAVEQQAACVPALGYGVHCLEGWLPGSTCSRAGTGCAR